MRLALLDSALAARAAGRAVALVTEIATGLKTLIDENAAEGAFGLESDDLDRVRAMLAVDRSGLLEDRLFVQIIAPPPRLLIVGAVHIAQALAPMATLAGYAVTVIDPRRAFASDQRFPDVAMSHDWPDLAIETLRPDRRTAIVTLSHDPKLDDPALREALASPAFYIGALGSRRTQASRTERLTADGFTAQQIARIRGPVGLPIHAVTAPEIAISILAEMTATRRGPAA